VHVHRLLRRGRRERAEARRLRRDLGPDRGLAAARVPVLAQRRVGGARRRLERRRRVLPAAGLDAARGKRQLRACGHERRPLEHPVLLGADELLALVEEDELVERVVQRELLDDALLADLGDGQPAGDGLVQADVVEPRLRGGEQRDQGKAPERARLAGAKAGW
jgi:hypothetical protein